MNGLTDLVSSTIQNVRLEEIASSFQYRKLLVWSIVISDVTSILGPVVTFALLTIIGPVRGTRHCWSRKPSLPWQYYHWSDRPCLYWFKHSHKWCLLYIVSFTRIQEFLKFECRKDDRICLQDSPTHRTFVSANVSVGAHSSQVDITEMKPLAATKSSISKGTAISVVDATFGWTKSGQATLKEINIVIQASSLIMIVGASGLRKVHPD